MYEPIDIYIAFRKSQANASNRGYRIPKDFESHFNNKMSKKNRDALILATDYFNTKWSNINPEVYFDCGFEILKGFTYINFFDERVLNLYKSKDKNKKREMEVNKEEIKKSTSFVKNYMIENEIKSLKQYARLRDNNELVCIQHYLKNKIDKYFLIALIKQRLIILNDDDRVKIPYIVEQYRECCEKLNDMKNYKKEGLR